MKKHIGQISLSIAIFGMILIQIGIRTSLLQGWICHVLLAGFTAGTVGSLADWFAVQALFHRIPIPLIQRHTNIIVNNRQRLTESIVDLVTNKWLGPDTLKERLAELTVIDNLLDLVGEPANKEKLANGLNHFIAEIIDTVDPGHTVTFLREIFQKSVAELEISKPVGGG